MLPIAGQTAGRAGPKGLKFFVDTHGWPWGVIGLKNQKNFKNIFFKFFFHGQLVFKYFLLYK